MDRRPATVAGSPGNLRQQHSSDYAQNDPESYLLTLLTLRAERKDTRVYAHATSETQTAIRDAYASRPVSRAANIVINTNEPGFLEVFPKVGSRPPKLLQELEALLTEKQRNADKAAWPGSQLPKTRDPGLAANLALDVQRQVFSAFTQGFSAYTDLLSRIQAHFESTLGEGLRAAFENVGLRQQLAEQAAHRARAGLDVRLAVLSEETGFRTEAFQKLQETRERTTRLIKRAAAVERDLRAAKEEQGRVQQQVDRLAATAHSLVEGQLDEEAWADQPTSSALQTIQVGPLSDQDRAFLDSEYMTVGQRRALHRTVTSGAGNLDIGARDNRRATDAG